MISSIFSAAFFFVSSPFLFRAAEGFNSPGAQFLQVTSTPAPAAANGSSSEEGREVDLAIFLGIKGTFAELEAILAPMYTSLPKDEHGRIGFPSLRYALHRALVQRHGWYVRGLAPDGKALQAASPGGPVKQWATARLLGVLERGTSDNNKRRAGTGSFSFHELVVLAATIEDLARREAEGRLAAIYRLHNIDVESTEPLAGERVKDVLDHYMLIYINTNNFNPKTAKQAMHRLIEFRHKWKGWTPLEAWLRNLQRNVTDTEIGSSLDFPKAVHVAEEVGTHYASYDLSVCDGLKQVLLGIEGERPGRVPLSAFYSQGMTKDTFFRFTEKVSYLRDLGALDDSDELNPSVIIPNYITGRHNCLEASKIYAVCCRSECEDLLTYVEKEIAESEASPDLIVQVIQAAPAHIVKEPKQLSAHLIRRLGQVAEINGGRVPLHGRLFAQWLHHVFPHECNYPHEAGKTSPSAPEEWMKLSGHVTTEASEEEMVCYVNGPCVGGPAAAAGNDSEASRRGNVSLAQVDASTGALKLDIKGSVDPKELPWTDKEELLVTYDSKEGASQDTDFFAVPILSHHGGMLGAFMASLSALSIYNIYLWGLDGRAAAAASA
jgi:hypothetical protein